jgi:YhcH/YjgK/YiaL family protein
MKRIILNLMLLTSIFGISKSFGQGDPSTWSAEKLDQWFQKGDWHKGWNVTPDPSINKMALAKAYFKNPERWDKAFAFMKNTDLTKIEVKRHDIDGDNLYVLVSQYTTKNQEDAKFEAHRKYVDIQYVISGNEQMGCVPYVLKDVVSQEYSDAKDIEYFSVKSPKLYKADPKRFFLFFPEDAHMPSIKDGNNSPVKKAVVKLKLD